MKVKSGFSWPGGKTCAVSITYDDAVPVHHEKVAVDLEHHGLRGTFYTPLKPGFLSDPTPWRRLAANGHELGNHSIFHPCEWNPGKKWLPKCYDLTTYTQKRFFDELNVANHVLHLIDRRKLRTYGNTCCHTHLYVGDEKVPMDPILKDLFVAARGPFNRRIVDLRKDINLMQLGHFGADGRCFAEIRDEIIETAKMGGWIVYMVHGVGIGTHSLYMDADEHELLIEWLGNRRESIWTAPLVEVAKYVKRNGE